jgi:phospholipid/cholesterol/gamma-HCH transport system substrate-binding protein
METRANYVAVGAFVLAVVTGVVVLVLWLAKIEFRDFALYDIYFTGSVTGLAQGAPVNYNGIQVGRVTEIRVDPQNLQQVRVTIEVNQPALIKSDAVASLESQGFTGVALVEIAGGSKDAPELEAEPGQRYPVIASRQSRLEAVVASAPEALARLIEVADRVAAILDDQNRAAIAETLDNIRRITAVAAAHAGDIDSFLGDTTAAVREMRATLAAANQVLLEFRQLVGERGEARNALQAIDEAARQLDRLTAHLDALVQENRPSVRDFTQRGLNELSQLMVDSRTLVAGLTRLADEIQRDPARFLFGDRGGEGYRPR